MQEKNILIIDDDWDILRAAQLLLKRHYSTVEIEQNPQKIPYLLNQKDYDLVLLDMNFSRDINTGKEGFHWLDVILDKNKKTKVILFTAYGDVEMAVRAMKNGASDFVLKPWENAKLLDTFQLCLEAEPIENEVIVESNIIGECPQLKEIFSLIEVAAPTEASILILGENGTGKDLLAKEIHKRSLRKDKSFVHADLGAVNENLFESELFGHVKGSFTDAKVDRVGKFQEADKGTIFLDEIGNIPLSMQKKLLFALQNKAVQKVGSNASIPVDARVIAATNSDIYLAVNESSFRQDLLFRINTIEIVLPPLRERGQDIILLAEHFLHIYNQKYKRKIKGIAYGLSKKLLSYPWPGNIRELQHVMERGVILATGHMLEEKDCPLNTQVGQRIMVDEIFELEDLERKAIIKALKKFNGNITDTSKELGLSRQALYRRIEKFNL